MSQASLNMIQISDIHLFADPDKALLGVKTQESFQAVIDCVRQHPEKVDLILLSGDLSQDNSKIAYERIAHMMKPLKIPVYYIPGNHDDESIMQTTYPCGPVLNDRHIILKGQQLILLNSQKKGAVSGYLSTAELTFLENCLRLHKAPAIIAFHHQPMPVGCHWLDQLGLQNADVFWETVAQYPQVKLVLFGHVHQEFSQEKKDIYCYATPSTCIQFKPQQVDFALDNIPPGYRWLKVYVDGKIETGIQRVARYVGMFDAQAKGY